MPRKQWGAVSTAIICHELVIAVWLNSNGVGHVNKVTLHPARLLMGWLTFCKHRIWPGILASNASQLSLATSQWMGEWILTVATPTAKDVMVCFYHSLLSLRASFSSSFLYATKARVSTDRLYFQGCRLTQQKRYDRWGRTVAWPCRQADAVFRRRNSRCRQSR